MRSSSNGSKLNICMVLLYLFYLALPSAAVAAAAAVAAVAAAAAAVAAAAAASRCFAPQLTCSTLVAPSGLYTHPPTVLRY